MSRKFYTIFILPHAHARFRKLHVSRNFVLAICVLSLAVGGAAAWAPHYFFNSRALAERAAAIELENQKLRADKSHYEEVVAQMGEQLAAVESVAGKLAQSVGLKDIPSEHPSGGAGKTFGARADIFGEESSALQKRIENLDTSFDRLEQAWGERLKVLASTPSLAPVSGFFSDGYGWRRDPIDGTREFHKGVDIVASTGTPVRASADGLVTAAGRMAGYGAMIQVVHGFGMSTRYGHLSRVMVAPGQARRRDRPRGIDRALDRSAPPLRGLQSRRAGRSAQVLG